MESEDSTYTMYDYTKRTVGVLGDKIENKQRKTKFSFDLEDLTPVVYIAETLTLI
jgi:lipopolysaccharide export system permease protein